MQIFVVINITSLKSSEPTVSERMQDTGPDEHEHQAITFIY